nr:MAG TPA: hypothetical protein [Bacteriophage sp.]
MTGVARESSTVYRAWQTTALRRTVRYNVEQRCYRFNSDNAHKRIYNYKGNQRPLVFINERRRLISA